jgi:hypothetical protein
VFEIVDLSIDYAKSYVLTVFARSTLGDRSLVQRQLRFTVGVR